MATNHSQGRVAESVGEGAVASRVESVADFDVSASWASLESNESLLRMAAGWRGGAGVLNGCTGFCTENGSGQVQNLALASLFVPSSLDSGMTPAADFSGGNSFSMKCALSV